MSHPPSKADSVSFTLAQKLTGSAPLWRQNRRICETTKQHNPQPRMKLHQGCVWRCGIQEGGEREREFFIDNLLVRVHRCFWCTGLAPWEFESPFPGGLISTFLEGGDLQQQTPAMTSQTPNIASQTLSGDIYKTSSSSKTPLHTDPHLPIPHLQTQHANRSQRMES